MRGFAPDQLMGDAYWLARAELFKSIEALAHSALGQNTADKQKSCLYRQRVVEKFMPIIGRMVLVARVTQTTLPIKAIFSGWLRMSPSDPADQGDIHDPLSPRSPPY